MTNRKAARSYAVESFVVGPMEVNCYVVFWPAAGEAVLIDPGAEPARIKRFLADKGLLLKFIINTHGHGDHIAADEYFECPIYIHKLDRDFLKDPAKNLSGAFGFPISLRAEPRLLDDGDVLAAGGSELFVLHTPGHTPGSISVRIGEHVFTGDALFHNSIGRTDFHYGDEGLLLRSIRDKLLKLDDDTIVYPGHGEYSTIGEERRSNPFL